MRVIVVAVQNGVEAACTVVAPVLREVSCEEVCEDEIWTTGVLESALQIGEFRVFVDGPVSGQWRQWSSGAGRMCGCVSAIMVRQNASSGG
jgi:hypothetical protein